MILKKLFLLASLSILALASSCIQSTNENEYTFVLKNGTVVDADKDSTYTADVLIADGKIAQIGNDISTKGIKTIDCKGMYITAGFIDSHVHVESSMVLPDAFGDAILPHGTTAIIADPHEIMNVAGTAGLTEFLDMAKKAPIDIFTCVSSSVPATPFDTNGAGKILAADMKPFVDRPDVVGLGEVMCFMDVANGNPEIMDKTALFKGKTIDGHTAGMDNSLIEKYVAAGVQNDHECYDPEGMLLRYEKGMNIYIREGSAAHNAKALLTCVKEKKLDVSKFALCTDDKHLADIACEGHISYIVNMARSMGFTWPDVAKMASFNPSRFYKLADRGNINEGFIADIVVTDSLCTNIAYVIKDGKIVAKDAKPTKEMERADRQLPEFKNTVNFKKLTANDFNIPQSLQKVAIGLVDRQLLTTKVDLKANEWKSLSILATIERYGKNGNIAVCPLKGYGIKNGAVATSVSHDSHNVVCAGDNGADMAIACNRLKAIGGGYVIASEGKIVGELALPAYGLMSTLDADSTSKIIGELEKTAHDMGVNKNIDPFTTLSFTALPVIPTLRLLDTGLFDVTTSSFIR